MTFMEKIEQLCRTDNIQITFKKNVHGRAGLIMYITKPHPNDYKSRTYTSFVTAALIEVKNDTILQELLGTTIIKLNNEIAAEG